LTYPADVFSLSHVALPFPMSDALYGMQPDSAEDFGVNLGAMATRGERGTLIVTLDALARMSSNPFFPYMLDRIEEGIGSRPTNVSDATSVADRLFASAVGEPGPTEGTRKTSGMPSLRQAARAYGP